MKPVSTSDIDRLVALQEDAEVRKVFGSATREEVGEWIAGSEREWAERGHGRVAIFDRKTQNFLGRCGLRHWPEFEEVEVGWVLRPEARGRGVATEAARACLDWGFRDLRVPYITAMISPDNSASIAVAERVEMSPLREDVLDGEPVVVYYLGRVS